MRQVGDLIEIPEIKTVIQLKDLEESHLRRILLQTFVVTGEVKSSLETILTSLGKSEGRGAFLKGHSGPANPISWECSASFFAIPSPGISSGSRRPRWRGYAETSSTAGSWSPKSHR